jgi:adenine deaminase
MIREGTSERNLDELIRLVPQIGGQAEFFFFCTDDKHVNDIESEGHIDFNVRQAIASGIPPIKAIKMATLNCARHFRLDQRVGCLAPGRAADIVLTKSLANFHSEIVFANGERIAEGGECLVDLPDLDWPEWTMNTVHVGTLTSARLAVPANGASARIRVIELVEDQIVNRVKEEILPVVSNQIRSSPERDILKMVCVDRHQSSGNVGVGFVRGFKLNQGAIGSSVSHDHHNIVVVGVTDDDIVCAVRALQEMRGGFVAVCAGQVAGKVALPLFGLMSLLSPEKLKKEMASLNEIARDLGCRLKGPFMTLGFVSLPTVPELGLTDKGLVDVAGHRLISVVV